MTGPGPRPGVTLRRTGTLDLDRVLEIEAAPDTAEWLGEVSRGWHAGALEDPDREHLLVRHEGRTAGFVVLAAPRGTEEGVELRRIVIAPEHRGRGLGRAALRAVLNHVLTPTPTPTPALWSHDALTSPTGQRHGSTTRGVGRVWLDVRPGNGRALALYASEGFVRERELPRSPGRPDGPVALVILARHRDRP